MRFEYPEEAQYIFQEFEKLDLQSQSLVLVRSALRLHKRNFRARQSFFAGSRAGISVLSTLCSGLAQNIDIQNVVALKSSANMAMNFHAYRLAIASDCLSGRQYPEAVLDKFGLDLVNALEDDEIRSELNLIISDLERLQNADVQSVVQLSLVPPDALDAELRSINQEVNDLRGEGMLDHSMDFWLHWYRRVVAGESIDWELQRRVALIEDDIWEAGPEAVAEEIERIRAEFERETQGDEPRQTAFEPTSVENLFTNKQIVGLNALQLVYDISGTIERFHAETGINQLPDTFLPLRMMPKSLTRISAILKHAPRTAETEQMLREEVGRLNAKIAQLETELQAARRSPDPIFSPALKKQAGTSLGDWKFYAALCAGLWVISGDDLGIQKRLENILLQRDALFGDECPTPELQDLIADNPAIEI